MADRLTITVRSALEACLPAKGRIVCGVSGGPDSVALLYLVVAACPQVRNRLAVVHVNHGLRGDAARRDEALVEAHSERVGVPCIVYRVDAAKAARERHCSLEDAGRRLRHESFLDACGRLGGTAVLLAHHQDDLVETFLLHLLRGAAGPGLAALPRCRPFPHPQAPENLQLIRPLLDLGKDDLLAYVRRRRLTCRHDQTNQDPVFTRNRIRKTLLPLLKNKFNPEIKRVIARTAHNLARDHAALEALAHAAVQAVAKFSGSDRVALSLPAYRSLLPAVRQRLLAQLWDRLGLPGKSAQHLENLDQLALGKGKLVSLPGQWRAARDDRQGRLMIFLPGVKDHPSGLVAKIARHPLGRHIFIGVQVKTLDTRPIIMKQPRNRSSVMVDQDRLPQVLRVRMARKQDRMCPLGMAGQSKSLWKILSEMKVPAVERLDWPVVTGGGKVIWVFQGPVAESVKVTPETRQAAQLSLIKARPRA